MTSPDFATRLLRWFRAHGRHDLPWQRDPHPYRIWISEIMLQQTQVATVVPYFERFVDRFPTVASLADAELDEVLHLWSGLGYYARARNLHSGARIVRDRFNGEMPRSLADVRALPGIGRSTAGAILSLSHGERHPILDGNVRRVLARCYAVEGFTGRAEVQKQLWALAEKLTPHERVADYNQAIMDLGALVCTRKPACEACPLADICLARIQGRQRELPAPKPPRDLPVKTTRMILVYRGGELLLERRPPSGVWGGLWAPPECPADQNPGQWCRDHLGLVLEDIELLPTRRHSFSHFHLDIMPATGRASGTPNRVMDGRGRVWYKLGDPASLGLAAPVSRLIEELKLHLRGDRS